MQFPVLLLLGALLLGVSGPSRAGEGVINCTNGCLIMTCAGGTCTIWRCSGSGGCVAIGSFPDTQPQGGDAERSSGGHPDPIAAAVTRRVQHLKSCDTASKTCSIYEFDGGVAGGQTSLLIEVPDVESIVDARRQSLVEAERQRESQDH
jgi:hypothetical protein